MNIEILLINLDRAPERLDFQSAQFRRLGLSFRRIGATDGASINESWYRRMRASGSRIVTRNEAGCVLSHAQCWKYAVETGSPVIVLEDDVILDPAFHGVANGLFEQARDENILINFEFHGGGKILGAEIARSDDSRFALRRLVRGGSGAAAYLVTPAVAGRLLSICERRLLIADTMINHPVFITYAQVAPAIAVQAEHYARHGFMQGDVYDSTIHTTRERVGSLKSFVANPMTRLVRLETNVRRSYRYLRRRGEASDDRLEPSPALQEYSRTGVPGVEPADS